MGTRNAVALAAPVSLPDGDRRLPAPAPRFAQSIAEHLRSANPAMAAVLVAISLLAGLIAVELLAGLLIRDVLFPGIVGQWDTDVSRWLADNRTPTLNDVSFVGSHLAGIWEVPIVMTIAVAVLFAVRKPWWGLMALMAILLEGGQYAAVTFLFARTRPDVHRLEELIANDSFPSGHTAASVVVYGGFALLITIATRQRWLHVLAWAVATLCIFLVAASRVYRGMHFLTDTIAGALFGAACLLIALQATRVGALVASSREDGTP